MPQLRLERDALVERSGDERFEQLDLGVARRPSGRLKPGPGMSAAEVGRHQRARIHDAFLELIAERGYEGITLRSLTRLAGVSTRTFYRHFADKDDCLLDVHGNATWTLLRRIEESSAGAISPAEKTKRAIEAIVGEWARDPRAARLMLVDATAGSARIVDQARWANRLVQAKLRFYFADGATGAAQSTATSVTSVGLLAGLSSAARFRLLTDGSTGLAGMSKGLTRWALSYNAAQEVLFVQRTTDCATYLPPRAPGRGRDSSLPTDERALIVSAASRLLAKDGHPNLTAENIASAAGLPKRSFFKYFLNRFECLIAVQDRRVDVAIEGAKQNGRKARAAASPWATIAALGAYVSQDPVLNALWHRDLSVTGEQRVQFQVRAIDKTNPLISEPIPSNDVAFSELAVMASSGAMWGVFENAATTSLPRSSARVAALGSYLAFASATDASKTLDHDQLYAIGNI